MATKRPRKKNDILLGHIELTEKQNKFIKTMTDPKKRVVFTSGPAGTSKSLISVYAALQLWNENRDLSIFYLRSVVESADRGLGFLKGDVDDKVEPYMAPLMDKLSELLNEGELKDLENSKSLEGGPINFLRGQSWRDKIVIVDEAQNLSKRELTTVMTRVGRDTKLYVCGDPMQSDIKNSGFVDFFNLFNDTESREQGIHCLKFDKKDIMRDPIVGFIVDKIEKSHEIQ
jgi:phosphate starvation-inducible protein PhoH and related proteins